MTRLRMPGRPVLSRPVKGLLLRVESEFYDPYLTPVPCRKWHVQMARPRPFHSPKPFPLPAGAFALTIPFEPLLSAKARASARTGFTKRRFPWLTSQAGESCWGGLG